MKVRHLKSMLYLMTIALAVPELGAFIPNPRVLTFGRNLHVSSLCAKEDGDKKKKGYQFGDITKNLVSKMTNKQGYEFGDVSRAIDKTVKEKVATLSGKDKNSYQFGDLTKLVDSRVKDQVNEFTNNDNYKFGDISKEILKRIKTRDYTMGDMVILFKILLAFGAGLSPIAQFLPAKFLIEMLDYSIVGDIGQKVATAVSEELDRRMKQAFTGDPEYKLGDVSKKAVLNYIGKEEYTFGDITNFVVDSVDEKKRNENDQGDISQSKSSILGGKDGELIAKELETWDKKFIIDAEFEDVTTYTSNTTSIK